MARPEDPDKLAALRARQAANSAAYRARQRAKNTPATPGTTEPTPTPRQPPSSEQAVIRAHEARAEAKRRRDETIAGLPSARNPRVNIYTPRPVPTSPAGVPETAAKRRQRIKVLRENTEAQRLQSVGRRRKQEIADFFRVDARSEAVAENLSKIPGGRKRFEAAMTKLSSVSQQTLAIFLQYEGGEGDLQSSLTQIAYPKGLDTEDALGRIETLAELATRAEGMYGPRKVGRLRI